MDAQQFHNVVFTLRRRSGPHPTPTMNDIFFGQPQRRKKKIRFAKDIAHFIGGDSRVMRIPFKHRIRRPKEVMIAPGHAVIRLRSEEHTSELQSLMRISYAVFCLKKKKMTNYLLFTIPTDNQ